MGRRKYPLEAARNMRSAKVDAAARVVEENRAHVARAEGALHERQRALGAHAARQEDARRTERSELARGLLSTSDLQNAQNWEADMEATRLRLEDAVRQSEDDTHTSRARLAASEGDLRAARVDEKVLARHEEEWLRGEGRRALEREETEVSEAWRPKTH